MAQGHPWQKRLAPILAPLSFVYGGVALLRRRLTEKCVLRSWMPPIPCVSVGNISWGGTGKTPVVDWILREVVSRGLNCAVLTRGYGVKVPEANLPLLVQAEMSPTQCGDEPLMLARKHPQARVLVDPERNRAARWALGQGAKPDSLLDNRVLAKTLPDMFLLDDGFQRVSTGRHVNIVLLDADDVRLFPKPTDNPSHWNRVLPWGTWREPAASLSAADVFLLKVEPEHWPALEKDALLRLARWPRPVFPFRLKPEGLRFCGTGDVETVVRGTPYLLLTGVGNPEQVRRTMRDFMGEDPVQHLVFDDHYDFTAQKEAVLTRLAQAPHNMPILCTAKDAVKLNYVPQLYALDVEAEFYAAHDDTFAAWFQHHFFSLFSDDQHGS